MHNLKDTTTPRRLFQLTWESSSMRQERMPPTASLLLIHYFLVLATVNLVITIPTANEYSERLGTGRLLLGIPGGG
jgi:hypothetical protein